MKGNMKKERIIASNTTGVFGAILVIMVLVLLFGGRGTLAPYRTAAAAQGLPEGDIVFIIDESGSMLEDINEIRARVDDIVN
jgi:hypothetical protein